MADVIDLFFELNNGGSCVVERLVAGEFCERLAQCEFAQVIAVGSFSGLFAEFFELFEFGLINPDG